MNVFLFKLPKEGSVFLIMILCAFLSFTLGAQCPQIVWEDNFDGTEVDQSKWSFQIGDGCSMGPNLCGWGNNELEWYQANNAVVEDGKLKIIAKKESANGKNYTSARMRSKGKGDWTYGRFEASIKLPTGKGLWPAFWMLSTNEPYGGWPQSGEIDIMELIGSEPDVAHGTVHFGSPWPNNKFSGTEYKLNEGSFNDGFHEFAVEWEAGEIRWYVDDYLYSTKTSSSISPWPFDQNMHFLLNVAVGGNWPGEPSFETTFPQTMEVEYVRVYDNYLPYITGSRKVPNQTKDVTYEIKNASAEASYTWTVPAGASIVSGEGTSSLTVDWGNTGGTIQVAVADACRTENISHQVYVEPAVVKSLSFENFDEPGKVILGMVSGTFEDAVTNPAPNEINGSSLVGKYKRDDQSTFDVLFYEVSGLGDAGDYLGGAKKFFMDIYSEAPIGTKVLLQLENKSQATSSNFPTGRHSRFEVVTTVQNEWERLEFKLLDRPDKNVSNTTINQFVILFAPNGTTGDTYHFDNFDSYGATTTVSTKQLNNNTITLINVSPNPIRNEAILQNISKSQLTQYTIMDLNGRLVRQKAIQLLPGQKEVLQLNNLPKGVYILSVIGEEGVWQNRKIVVLG